MEFMGLQIKGYLLQDKIRDGTVGTVWRATDSRQKTVAIKQMSPASAANADKVRQFDRESSILQKFVHKNIIKVHERLDMYGNVIYTNYRIVDEINEQNGSEWRDDYNFYVTRDDVTPSGIKCGGVHYQNGSAALDMGDYRANEGQGLHSNLVGATTHELNGAAEETWMEAQIPGFASGDLSLAVGSDLIDIVPPCPVTARLGQSFYNAGYQPL